MKNHVIFALLAMLAAVFMFQIKAPTSVESQFKEWMALHGKEYSKEDYIYRYNIFAKELKEVEEHNVLYEKGEISWGAGLNYYSDLTQQEFKARYIG